MSFRYSFNSHTSVSVQDPIQVISNLLCDTFCSDLARNQSTWWNIQNAVVAFVMAGRLWFSVQVVAVTPVQLFSAYTKCEVVPRLWILFSNKLFWPAVWFHMSCVFLLLSSTCSSGACHQKNVTRSIIDEADIKTHFKRSVWMERSYRGEKIT